MSSPEKYLTKNSYNKKIFYLNEKKKMYNKTVSYWLQTYFDWIKIFFDIMKKNDIMKTYVTECKFILIEQKHILISYEFLFLQHFSNHTKPLTEFQKISRNRRFNTASFH